MRKSISRRTTPACDILAKKLATRASVMAPMPSRNVSPESPLHPSRTDPAPVLDLLRASHATELLVASVAHLNVFGLLAERPCRREGLRDRLGLADRPAHVLITALRAMGLLTVDARGHLTPSLLAADARKRQSTLRR